MPSKQERSTDAMSKALHIWAGHSYTLEKYAFLYDALVEVEADQASIDLLLGSLERHVQDMRMRMLDERWGGVENGTPQQAREVELPQDTLVQLHGVTGFHGIPRAFMFLYIHAYLWYIVTDGKSPGPLESMEYLLSELDPR